MNVPMEIEWYKTFQAYFKCLCSRKLRKQLGRKEIKRKNAFDRLERSLSITHLLKTQQQFELVVNILLKPEHVDLLRSFKNVKITENKEEVVESRLMREMSKAGSLKKVLAWGFDNKVNDQVIRMLFTKEDY